MLACRAELTSGRTPARKAQPVKPSFNRSAATLFGSLLLASTLGTYGCGDDNRDAFNDVVLPPTVTATTTTSTTTSTSTSTTSNTVTTSTTTGAPTVVLNQSVVFVQRGATAAVFPAATVSGTNTNFAGSTVTISLPSSTTSGLTLVAPANANGITSALSNNGQTLTVTLGAATTAQQAQDFIRNIQVAAGQTATFGSTSFTVTAAGPSGSNQTVTSTGTVQVTGSTAGTAITVDPNQATNAAARRFATLQEAVNFVATGDSTVSTANTTDNGRAGSRIQLVAGSETVGNTNGALNGSVIIGQPNITTNTFDPDLVGLTIVGPNAGISAGATPVTRAAEYNLTGGIVVAAPNVSLNGFTILEGGNFEGAGVADSDTIAGVDVNTNAANTSISNIRFVRTADSLTIRSQAVVTSSIGVAPNNAALRVTNSYTQGWTRGVYLYGEANDTTPARVGDVVTGNFFTGATYTGIAVVDGTNETVTGNVIKQVGGAVANTNYFLVRVYNDTDNDLTGLLVNGNDFDNSADVDVTTAAAGDLTVDLRSNWWNNPSGPAASITGNAVNTVHPAIRIQQNAGTTIAADTTSPLGSDPFPNR